MIIVPENTIASIPHDDFYKGKENEVFVSLVGQNKRDWFNKHAYFCLPLVIGNQYGFAVKSLYDFTAVWNGRETPFDCQVMIDNQEDFQKNANLQRINSHFGLGIITVQTAFTLRTPPNVNLITMNPPNAPIDGLTNLTGVIETDNLRRDFTFNLKITRPHYSIQVKKGDLLSAFLPYPRNYFEHYEIKNGYDIFSEEQIKEEQKTMHEFGKERKEKDIHKPNRNGRRYFKGVDVYDNEFQYLHQKNLRNQGKDLNDALTDE